MSPAYAALADAETSGPRWEGRRVGAYRLVREIGRGGMSRVFLAERADGEFEQQVALKLLRPGFDSDIDVMRFRAERQILASLNHPNIARLLDGGMTDDALPYLVLEYIDGAPVDRFCQSRGLSTRQRLQLFLTIAEAVEYAHGNSVVHRDLKPSNVLVTSDGAVKLLDFGVAKLLEQHAPGARPTTRTTHRWLTPDYAAPEQIRGKGITPRTDVYQLGAALYELLTGRTPFGHCGETIHELERAILERDPDSLGETLGGDLDAIALKALRKNPDERYASASEFADDVRRHLTGHPVHARRRTLGYRSRRFVYRNRFRLAAAAVIVMVLATFVTTVSVEQARSRRALAALTSRVGVADSVPPFVNELLWATAAGIAERHRAARALVQGSDPQYGGPRVDRNDRPRSSKPQAPFRRNFGNSTAHSRCFRRRSSFGAGSPTSGAVPDRTLASSGSRQLSCEIPTAVTSVIHQTAGHRLQDRRRRIARSASHQS